MFKIFGPPGTGKTTTLLNMVDNALAEGIAPQEIAFFAFTRKAANEAKERASARFDLDPKTDLYFFRTIHSLAFRLLDIKPENLMQEKNFEELGKELGFMMMLSSRMDFDEVYTHYQENPILNIINLSKLKKRPLESEYNDTTMEFTWHEVDYVARGYQKYKEIKGLVDYTDMLVLFAQNIDRMTPEFELCFLDEAQDLSPLQWDIAEGLDRRSKKMYIAGDDDQSIFRWAGATAETLINLDCASEVLKQSYRIPRSVHRLANRIIKRVVDEGGQRFPKEYLPRDEEGMVCKIHDLYDLDFSEGEWLIMAQANYMLTEVAMQLKTLGYLYERNDSRSIPDKLSTAVNTWEHLRKGGSVDLSSAKAVYAQMSGNGKRIARGKKTLTGEMFNFDILQREHGLLATKDMIWSEALDRIPDRERAYITALLRRGEKFNAKPRIKLSTIHGTKGGEAENVVLFTDLTSSAIQSSVRGPHPQDIHRVFYVAVTRTKQNLFIVEPENYDRAYII